MDRATGGRPARFSTDACFAFHHVNAFEQGEEVVVDLCTYPDASIVEDLYLDRLRAGKPITPARSRAFGCARRPHGDPRASAEGGLELPRINYGRCNERPYRHVWGNGLGPSGWLEGIVKVDTHDGATRSVVTAGLLPRRARLRRGPEAEREDEGVLLSVVLDAAREHSFLLVLDARDLSELARAQVPTTSPSASTGSSRSG